MLDILMFRLISFIFISDIACFASDLLYTVYIACVCVRVQDALILPTHLISTCSPSFFCRVHLAATRPRLINRHQRECPPSFSPWLFRRVYIRHRRPTDRSFVRSLTRSLADRVRERYLRSPARSDRSSSRIVSESTFLRANAETTDRPAHLTIAFFRSSARATKE